MGGSLKAGAVTFSLGDDASDRQYRSILSFNTSTLPDNAVVTGITLGIRRQGFTGADPFTVLGTIRIDSSVAGARVTIDDQPRGQTPVAPIQVTAPASYAIQLSKPGYVAFRATVASLRRSVPTTRGKSRPRLLLMPTGPKSG